MIIVKLQGGLGNQMFQYACGRAVSLKHNVPLHLDISAFPDHNGRTFRLNEFNIKAEISDVCAIQEMNRTKKSIFRKIFSRIGNKADKIICYKEYPPCVYDEKVFDLGGSVFLDGYWQSERYFKKIEGFIRKELMLGNEIQEPDQIILDKINRSNSVSIHVRRGDYLTNLHTLQTHGVLGINYYLKAIDIMSRKINDPVFFVFSDDIEWCKENIKISLPLYFVDSVKNNDILEMHLMSQCKHHIIANSSFSWWGAWLCENKDKIVIAPEKWFSKEEINIKDIIPDEWLKVCI